MGRFLRIVGAAAGALIIVLAAFYAYFLYAPVPEEPKLSARAETETIVLGGHERRFTAYVPAQLPQGAPLIIVLHGRSMTGAWMRSYTAYEFDTLADAKKFAVIYPDAYHGNWSDCRTAGDIPSRREHIDDIAFMRALIAEAHRQYGTATDKVYFVGYSNGGSMAITLATQHPSLAAGIAAFASGLSVPAESDCPRDTPTPPVMMVNGTADPIHPFKGGAVSIFGLRTLAHAISAPDTAAEFARRDGIAGAPAIADLPHLGAGDPTSVRRFTWSRAGKPYIVFYQVNGGGHVVPQPLFRFPRIAGRTAGDLDGPKEAVAFFLP